jgi:hypothetical protein
MSSAYDHDNQQIKPDKKKAKLDTSEWPLLMKVNFNNFI